MDKTTYYCKCCGVKVSPDAKSVMTHYENKHFSEWVNNRETMSRCPKAFVCTAKQITISRDVVQRENVIDTTAIQSRKANKQKIMSILSDGVEDRQPYRGNGLFLCPCCNRTLRRGMLLFFGRNNTMTLCYDCYKITKDAIPSKRKPREILIPFGGMTSWQKK